MAFKCPFFGWFIQFMILIAMHCIAFINLFLFSFVSYMSLCFSLFLSLTGRVAYPNIFPNFGVRWFGFAYFSTTFLFFAAAVLPVDTWRRLYFTLPTFFLFIMFSLSLLLPPSFLAKLSNATSLIIFQQFSSPRPPLFLNLVVTHHYFQVQFLMVMLLLFPLSLQECIWHQWIQHVVLYFWLLVSSCFLLLCWWQKYIEVKQNKSDTTVAVGWKNTISF